MHILSFGAREVPAHRFCATCEWVNLHVPIREIASVMKLNGLWPVLTSEDA